ncbi:MAG: FAD-dependent oxidoreductase [Syntrophaceae bacterium]|nr:FAD-dependent oxidoreductase [Syntrophaceae bacterium]
MSPYKTLFSPFRIGKLELKNRIVMPPMATNFAVTDGKVNDRHIAYYVKRAQGGVGYITFEHTGIVKEGKASPGMALIDGDEKIPLFKKLVDAVHKEGGKIFIQINHAGRQTSASITGAPIVGPSAIPCPVRKEMPHPLSMGEIQGLVEAFRQAARRVKEAGADGVEVHMAHGYLLCQFLSPFSNQRDDDYGGTPEKRLKMPLEVLNAVRKTVGPDFPIVCRLSADEYVEGGLKLEDSIPIAQALEKNGADALHISACIAPSGYLNHPPYYVGEGVFTHLARGIKGAVKIPVIAVGRIRTPELANQVIEENKADLVSMGRALIADPFLPRKSMEGKAEDIIPCISCNRCILSIRKGDLQCAVNPETGREATLVVKQSEHPQKVWVIGGGPAGMKAAEIAARRGHRVTLFEAKDQLGGQFLLAAIPPHKQVLKEFVTYLGRQIDRVGVKTVLNKSFDLRLLEKEQPNAVVLATGAKPLIPEIEGIHKAKVCNVWEALSKPGTLGERILVVGGGGVGAEVADFLSEKGKKVTLVEMREAIALDLVAHLQHYLNLRLKNKEVQVLTSTKALRFEEDGLWVEGPQGTRKLTGFDSVVISMGSVSDAGLTEELKKKVAQVLVIGDAAKPREVMEAVLEAEEAAIRL